MIAIKQSIWLAYQYPKMKNTIHGLIKTQDSSTSKLKSKQQGTKSRMFTNKSMTLRIHFLNNYEAGTCNYTKTFQYVQHHSLISKTSLARSTQIKKYIRQPVAQSNNVRIQMRYSGTCIYICHFSEQTIGFKTQNFHTSITGFIISKIVINFQTSIFYYESKILYALNEIFNVQFTRRETNCQRKLSKNNIPN